MGIGQIEQLGQVTGSPLGKTEEFHAKADLLA